MTGQSNFEDFDIDEAVSNLDKMKNDTASPATSSQPVGKSIENFTRDLDEQYPDLSPKGAIHMAVNEVWPADSFREHQKEAIVDTVYALYVDDYDVVTISAPTGAGKSLILYAVSRVLSHVSQGTTFSTTPLNTLIDQIEDDGLIEQVVTMKGKNNYSCVHRMDKGASVDDAICQRMSGFDCEHKDKPHTSGGCPYYGRKNVAQRTDVAVTNLSYLMANAMIPSAADAKFEKRDLLAIDEVQNVENFALQFIGFTVAEHLVPVNFDILPEMPGYGSDMEEMVDWLYELLRHVIDNHERLTAKQKNGSLTTGENNDKKKLKRFQHRLSNFLQDHEEGRHWTKTHDDGKVIFEPVFIGRFIDKFLWSQCEKVVLSSATIPKGDFIENIGLGEQDVYNVSVESTFPKERRPVITTEMVGKMTRGERNETIPKMAERIGKIADAHAGERGFIHCNSYKIAQRLYDNMSVQIQDRTRIQDQDDREGSFNQWLASDDQMFLSVAMDEGISLDDDKARWQVVAKASYPFMGDERVSYRVNELGHWDWYANQAIINLQQAVGRGMRSKDDYCVTYLLDESFKSLIDRNGRLFEGWFMESIDCENDLQKYESPSKFSFSA